MIETRTKLQLIYDVLDLCCENKFLTACECEERSNTSKTYQHEVSSVNMTSHVCLLRKNKLDSEFKGNCQTYQARPVKQNFT